MKYDPIDIAFRLATLTKCNYSLMMHIVEEWIKIEKDYKKIEEVKELEEVQAKIKDLLMEKTMCDAGYRSDGK